MVAGPQNTDDPEVFEFSSGETPAQLPTMCPFPSSRPSTPAPWKQPEPQARRPHDRGPMRATAPDGRHGSMTSHQGRSTSLRHHKLGPLLGTGPRPQPDGAHPGCTRRVPPRLRPRSPRLGFPTPRSAPWRRLAGMKQGRPNGRPWECTTNPVSSTWLSEFESQRCRRRGACPHPIPRHRRSQAGCHKS